MENVIAYIVFVVIVTCYRPIYGQRCREHLIEATGRIVSPDFPRNYSSHLNCSWTIEAPQGQSLVVEVTVEVFELEDSESCSNDYLAVYDGPTSDSPVLLPPSCGSRILWPVYPSTLLSTGRTMTIVFVSNGAISAGGFRANFNQVAPREDFMLAVDVTNKQILKQDRLSVVSQALPVVGLQNPVGIEFDPIDRKVYFSDVVSDIIGRINIDGTDQETIVSSLLEVPDGLAVDYVSRVMYWTDTGTNTISLARLDGKLRRVLHDSNLGEPRDILVHQNQGYIYWSDWGSFPKIEKSEGDGSNRAMIVTDGLGWPNGLALDGGESKLYWADAELNRIERIDLDGSHRELLKAFNTDVHPFGLVVSGNGIFWTDWVTKGIDAADYRFEEEPLTFLVNGQEARLNGLVHHTSSVASHPERDCSYGLLNSGCEDLCVLTPTGTTCLAARPIFENCPREILIWTNETTLVTWRKPSAWSPSGVNVNLSSSHDDVTSMTLSPSDDMMQITYFAVDEFENQANCTFSISVAYDDLPQTVSVCPKDIKRKILPSQNETVVFWEEPAASDNSAVCTPGCRNGGQCVGPDKCQCTSGYGGQDCSEAQCLLDCQNGGTCLRPDYCRCPPAYRGSRCEIGYCRERCRNGGTCIGADTCKCTRGYTGAFCKRSKCPRGCPPSMTCVGHNRCIPNSFTPRGSKHSSTGRKTWCPLTSFSQQIKTSYVKPVIRSIRISCGPFGLQSCNSQRLEYTIAYRTTYKTSYRCANRG